MRIIALGTSEFVKHCISGLLDSGQKVLLLMSLRKEFRPDNSIELSEFASEQGLDYAEVEDINSPESVAIMRTYTPDVIFSTWPKILKKPVFKVPRFCVIGTHPTALPFNRGRHPLHWEIVLGFSESKLSFFRMDEGVDTGRILLQVPYEIRAEDIIADLVARVNSVGYHASRQLGQILDLGKVPEGKEQDHIKANYWRKRTRHDVTLDLRMSAEQIFRIVRSFTLPYPCVMLLFDKYILHVVNANIVPTDLSFEELQRIEPGKIIQASGCQIRVKVADGIIDLTCQSELPPDLFGKKYIHPPSKYLVEHSDIFIPYFGKNVFT